MVTSPAVFALIDDLLDAGVRLAVEGGRLVSRGRPGAVTPALADAVRANRDALLALLHDGEAFRAGYAAWLFDAEPLVPRGPEAAALPPGQRAEAALAGQFLARRPATTRARLAAATAATPGDPRTAARQAALAEAGLLAGRLDALAAWEPAEVERETAGAAR